MGERKERGSGHPVRSHVRRRDGALDLLRVQRGPYPPTLALRGKFKDAQQGVLDGGGRDKQRPGGGNGCAPPFGKRHPHQLHDNHPPSKPSKLYQLHGDQVEHCCISLQVELSCISFIFSGDSSPLYTFPVPDGMVRGAVHSRCRVGGGAGSWGAGAMGNIDDCGVHGARTRSAGGQRDGGSIHLVERFPLLFIRLVSKTTLFSDLLLRFLMGLRGLLHFLPPSPLYKGRRAQG